MNQTDAVSRLIETAVQMLLDDPQLLWDGGLRGEDVCKRASVSQTTFYRHFNKQTFIDAVSDRLIPADYRRPDELQRYVREMLAATARADPRSMIRDLVTADFEAVIRDDVTRRRLSALPTDGTESATANNLRNLHAVDDASRRKTLLALFSATGASVRSPFSINHVAVALSAIIDGLMLRKFADPGAVPNWLPGEIVLAMLASAIDTQHLHQHVDDVAAALADSSAYSQSRTLPEDPRAAVVDAARDEFTQRGYFSTSMESIAARSGVPLSHLRRLFPFKQQIIVAALARKHADLAASLADDVAIGHGDIAVIERHLLRCAPLVAAEPAFMDAMLAVVVHDSRTDADGFDDMARQDRKSVV